MNKKKILIFVESLYCGGAEKSLTTMLNKICLENYDIELMMIKKGGEFEINIPKGIEVSYLNFNPSLLSRLKFKTLRELNIKKAHNAQLLWKSVEQTVPNNTKSYDTAIGWGQGFATYYVANKVRSKKKLAWVNTDYLQAGYQWAYDRYSYEKIDTIVTVSEYINQIMSSLTKKEVITIPNIIDQDEILRLSNDNISIELKENHLNIVTVARLEKPKALHLAIDAAKTLRNQELIFHWYIIGEGSERSQLEESISLNGLDKHISILGFRQNPYPYIDKASIYIQTSEFEGLGRTLIEAVILNKPIISTNFPTAYDILKGVESSLIVGKSGQEIAGAVNKIINSGQIKQTNFGDRKLTESDITIQTVKKIENLLSD